MSISVDGSATPGTISRPRRDGASALAVASAVVVALALGSWWANRPGGPGAALTAVGQLTGLLATIAALATGVLMARVPAVEASLGADGGLVWHRRAGVATAGLLAAHVVTIVAGYAAADSTGFAHEISTLLDRYPDMITATVGAALLGAVTVSSIRAIRRRFHHETWLFGHWYVYPAVALAFGHELSDGASFVHGSTATLAWTWLHLFVLCLLGWYRLVLPVTRMAQHRIVVDHVVPAGARAVSVVLSGDGLDGYGAVAGQHLRIRFLTPEGWWQSHPFSLSARPGDRRWRITIADEGDHTAALQDVQPGTRVLVSGAHGNLTAGRRLSDRVLLVAGGSGITPLRAVLEDLPPTADVRVVYRARTADDVLLRDELDLLAAAHHTTVDYLVGPRNPDARRDVLSPDALRRLVPDLAARDAYVCGGNDFVDVVAASLRANGVPPDRLHTERFDP